MFISYFLNRFSNCESFFFSLIILFSWQVVSCVIFHYWIHLHRLPVYFGYWLFSFRIHHVSAGIHDSFSTFMSLSLAFSWTNLSYSSSILLLRFLYSFCCLTSIVSRSYQPTQRTIQFRMKKNRKLDTEQQVRLK